MRHIFKQHLRQLSLESQYFGNALNKNASVPANSLCLEFLGTSSSRSTLTQGGVFLFDCGEGTSRQMLHSQMTPNDVKAVFITHLHGDHMYGLPALGMILNGHNKEVPLFAPSGLQRLEDKVYSLRGFKIKSIVKPNHHNDQESGDNYISFDSAQSRYLIYEDDDFIVEAGPLRHSIFCVGYSIREKGPKLRFDVEKIAALNIPPGPHFRDLQSGRDATLPDGRTITPQQILQCPQLPRKIVILGDTCDSRGILPIAKDADVLVHESTCLDEEKEIALRHMHSTAGMAGEFARRSGAKALILTHFSPRNFNRNKDDYLNEAKSIGRMVEQAKLAFGNDAVYPASDFWKFVIPHKNAHPSKGDSLKPEITL